MLLRSGVDEKLIRERTCHHVSNALFNYEKASEDQAKHVSNILSADPSSNQNTVEPRFNEVAGDRPNLFVKWRVRYIENLDITNLRGKDQNVRYIEVKVND